MIDNARFDAVLDRIDRFNMRNGSTLSVAIDEVVSFAEDLRAENAHQSRVVEAQREVINAYSPLEALTERLPMEKYLCATYCYLKGKVDFARARLEELEGKTI